MLWSRITFIENIKIIFWSRSFINLQIKALISLNITKEHVFECTVYYLKKLAVVSRRFPGNFSNTWKNNSNKKTLNFEKNRFFKPMLVLPAGKHFSPMAEYTNIHKKIIQIYTCEELYYLECIPKNYKYYAKRQTKLI